MVALFVLATFAIFIGIDVLLHREKYAFKVAEDVTPQKQPVVAPVVAGVALPETLAYHPGHAWALDQGNGRIRVGLDGLAAAFLGQIQAVEGPKRGRWLRQGDRGWTIRNKRGEVMMLAPAEGEVVAVNEKALANPAVISQDPYGAGWIAEMTSPDAPISFRNLMSGGVARSWMEESMAMLRQAFAPMNLATVTAQDGGLISPRLGDEIPEEKWKDLASQLFRT
jgi:glycine cleavage system H protein